jgi:hypothetical protein
VPGCGVVLLINLITLRQSRSLQLAVFFCKPACHAVDVAVAALPVETYVILG